MRSLLTVFFILMLSSCAGLRAGYIRSTSASYSNYIKGQLNDKLGSVDEAVVFYKQLQKIDKQTYVAHEQLGLDYIRLKDFAKAVVEFEKLTFLSPQDNNARYVLSLLYVQLGDFKKAALCYERILEKEQGNKAQNIQLRRILSQLYFLDENLAQARKHCAEVLKSNPSDEWGLYMTAMIDSEEGHIQESIAGFKEVLKSYPDNHDAMNSLAYVYAQEGIELDQALSLIEKALEYDPDNGAYLDTAGWVYFKLGDIDRALEYLKKALRLEVDPVISRHLKEAQELKEKVKKEKGKEITPSLKHL